MPTEGEENSLALNGGTERKTPAGLKTLVRWLNLFNAEMSPMSEIQEVREETDYT